jgi:hypothetical protein
MRLGPGTDEHRHADPHPQRDGVEYADRTRHGHADSDR